MDDTRLTGNTPKPGAVQPAPPSTLANIPPFESTVWLASPTMHGGELSYMTEAYTLNWMTTIGKNIDEAERLACEQIGCRYAVGLASGTSALHLCMRLCGVQPGERVFCSDLTFSATVNPVVYEGGVPIFIDSEPDTWNMDPNALEKAFSLYPDVRVVVIANLYGTPAKLDAIRAICHTHGAKLIEDAAESLGATLHGQQTGRFGDYSVISFNGNKIITGSSGGMLLTDSAEDAATIRKWSTQSRENAPWYQHEALGYNYRMSNVIAGVVRGQFPHLAEHIARKKAIYQRYREGLQGLPLSMNPYDPTQMEPNFWLSCLLIDAPAMCPQERTEQSATYTSQPGKSCPTELYEQLTARNAQCRPIWKPMHMQPFYRDNPFVSMQDGLAVGEDIFARGLCLPSDIRMTPDEQDTIIQIIRLCFQ